MKQNDRILEALQKRGDAGLTSMDAFQMGITRLASRIHELRKLHTIGDVWVKGRGNKYKRYVLQ
tara:strand:+ start:2359 stop:2550 length:192 start_codon:yes stop_codon:yes gene_type:complete